MRTELIPSSVASSPDKAVSGAPPEALPAGVATAPPPDPAETTPSSPMGGRCREKGCVFPAAPTLRQTCLYHDRQLREPKFFRSRQPTTLVLGQAIFSQPETESEDTRQRDRRRLYAQREAFLEEAA